MVSDAKNGHYNSQNGTGAKGGGTPRMRRGMQLLAKTIEAGNMTPDELIANLRWAQRLKNDKSIAERVRMRAGELEAKIQLALLSAAVDLDKMERLESEDATERVETFDVRVPRVSRLGGDE